MRRRIKALLLGVLGERATAWLQALHYVRMLRSGRYFDPAYEFYEPELDLLPRLLAPGDVAVDVGALGANFTVAMQRAVGDRGLVLAFEAHPFHARATALAIRFLGLRNVRFFPFGLSSEPGEALLRVGDAAGERCEGESAIESGAPDRAARYATIRLETLDGLAAEQPRLAELRLLKIDVEGHELFVLRGARQVIERARPVVILEKGDFTARGYTCADVHAFLAELGYQAFVSVEGGALAATDTTLEHAGAVSPNRVFLPSEEIDELRDLLRA